MLRASRMFYIRGIIAGTGVTGLVYYIIWLSDYKNKSCIQPKKCPTLLTQKTSLRDVYGFNTEVQEALSCRFEERKRRLQRACMNTGPHPFIPTISEKNSVDGRTTFMQQNFTVCTIEKIGSQFLKKFFSAFEHETGVKGTKTKLLKENDYRDSVKVVFVREPYTRLFSGYIDKFFAPNPAYWKVVGFQIINALRYQYNQLNESVNCGTDVTFSEFVDTVLHQLDVKSNIDNHFKPMHFRCEFCKMDYDYIGKMETFLDDFIFVCDKMGLLKYNHTREFILKNGFNTIREMERNTRNLFKFRLKEIEDCGVSLHQALKVTWRRWQIRGFIETRFPFPFQTASNTISWKQFFKSALTAHKSSDKRKLADAKMAAMQEAYSALSFPTKLRLKEYFLPEFDMFGYDPMPEKVFGKYESKTGFSFLEKKTIFSDI